MKQTIIITLTLFLFSCNNDNVTISKEEYQQLKGDTIQSEYPKISKLPDKISLKADLITIIHDNHEIILWLNGYGSQMIHKPDCKYCSSKRDSI